MLAGLANALTPVWDQDGLMYHLPGASAFYKAGRFILLPEIWQANGPFTVEMLYIAGLAIGSPAFAKLVHFSFAGLLALATYSFGKRYLGTSGGFWAAAILLGTPMVVLIGSLAYADVAWALFSFLGIYAVLLWQEEHHKPWLICAGLMMGLALGVKYLAWPQLLILGLWVFAMSVQGGWRQAAGNTLTLGLAAVLVGSPWYLKNLLLSGNPIYPFVLGGAGWSPARLAALSAFLNRFGSGKTLPDLLAFPWNVFVNGDRFTTSPFDLLNFTFLLAPLVLWMKRPKALSGLAILTGMGFIPWWFGSQQTRFLLPLLPGLSLTTAFVLIQLTSQPLQRGMQRIGVRAAVLSLAALQLIYVFSFLFYIGWIVRPLPVILGLESKDAFLSRMVDNYAALRYVESHYPEGTGVSVFWDGSGYYCESCNLATAAQWSLVSPAGTSIEALTANFRNRGLGLVLYNRRDRAFFLSHDPGGAHRAAADFVEKTYFPACGQEVYADKVVTLYELACK